MYVSKAQRLHSTTCYSSKKNELYVLKAIFLACIYWTASLGIAPQSSVYIWNFQFFPFSMQESCSLVEYFTICLISLSLPPAPLYCKNYILQIYSEITRGRVLNRELNTQRLQQLIYLCLSTDCFMKISLHSSGPDKWRKHLHETVCRQTQIN